MINKFLVLSLLAANPAAALAPATSLPRYTESHPSESYARAVAVYANGDVLFVGQITSIGPVIVRMDPALGVERWRKVLSTYNGMVPYCAATSGETAFIGGSDIGATIGRVLAVNGTGDVIGVFGDGFVGSGFRGLATDPVDGTVWAVGRVQVAPERARLVHLSAGLAALSTDDYQSNGQATRGAAVAVTRDRVYVGGQAFDPSFAFDRPWIMARSRTSQVAIFHKFQTTVSQGWVTSLSAFGDDVYSYVSYESPASVQNSVLFRNDPATGAFTGQTALITNASMVVAGDFTGGVVRHPSLPVVIASTANGFRCFKPDLTEISGSAGTFVAPGFLTPSWVAVSNTLEFSVYGAYSFNQAAFWKFHGTGVRMSSPFDAVETKSKLVVAPNRLDLTKSSAKIRFVVKAETLPATGEIMIYDLAGHLVIGLPFEATHGATADVLWDGKREDGTRVGTGGYLAVADGDGFEAGTDRALFVITGAPQ